MRTLVLRQHSATGARLWAGRAAPRRGRRIARLVAVGLGLATIVSADSVAGAQEDDEPSERRIVDVIEVDGYLDPVLVDFVGQAIDEAERVDAAALVLQLDSPGVLVGEGRFQRLLERVADAEVNIGVWVGPSGATADGDAARLVEAASFAALAPGSRLDAGAGRIGADAALERGLIDFPADCRRERGSEEGCASTVGDFIVSLPGVESREVRQGDETRLEPLTTTRFSQLALESEMLHTVASPAVAYLLFVIGMALIVFELFTAGIGVAGVVGAVSFVLGCYGLAVLPTTPVGAGLLVLAMFGFSIDIQTGVPRAWTAVATVAFAAGSLLLYDGMVLSWITLLVAIAGMALAMLAGMPSMVRTRFSTPTIGREWMIGEQGTARLAVDPDGVVLVRDAPWRARTNRATPIARGEAVRVVGIDGLLLEVEPLQGAAEDYRERAKARRSPSPERAAPASSGNDTGPASPESG